MYWTEYENKRIQSANLDGTDMETLVTMAGSRTAYAIALDVADGKMHCQAPQPSPF